MLVRLLTIEDQFALLVANIADLKSLHKDDNHALTRLDAAHEAAERGLALVRREIEETRKTRPTR